LVLSGGTKKAELDEYAYRPTYMVKSIAELLTHELFEADVLRLGTSLRPVA
jgi:hypothetical protein